MNRRKLEGYLAKCQDLMEWWCERILTNPLRKPSNEIDNSTCIIWLGDKGWTSTRGVDYLSDHCSSLKEKYGDFHLFIWLGTCDMTTKDRKYVSLNENYSRDAANLIQNIKKR